MYVCVYVRMYMYVCVCAFNTSYSLFITRSNTPSLPSQKTKTQNEDPCISGRYYGSWIQSNCLREKEKRGD